jgi:hypothetical protein
MKSKCCLSTGGGLLQSGRIDSEIDYVFFTFS